MKRDVFTNFLQIFNKRWLVYYPNQN